MGAVLILGALAIPCILTIWNIVTLIQYATAKEDKKYLKFLEVAAMALGFIFMQTYMGLEEITSAPWSEQLYNNQLHSVISPESLPTVVTLAITGLISYVWLRFTPTNKQPPLLLGLAIAGVYIGIVLCIVWCVQTNRYFLLMTFPANCVLLFVKVIYITVHEKDNAIQNGQDTMKYKKLSQFLGRATNLPLVGILLFLPLLGMLVAVLYMFGQEPNSVIKAWTETADWTLSQKEAPSNIAYDEHYLCTVAAGGHEKIVKPIRPGLRHGHTVIVNRQLCVANAFEEVIMEKLPKIHKVVRGIYDDVGYPIAKHIQSRFVADLIYFLMKPLEYFFVIVLYLVDVHPEDRIAMQYPHQTKPN